MIYIKNFQHDVASSTITFEVEREGVTNKVETKGEDYGSLSTDIDSFTEEWTDAEYEQLDKFLDGCQEVVHPYYH
ncbi:hypothetical protein ACSFB8_04385 [Enterococcus faecalis]